MKEPIITFEREVVLRKVLKIPDARYKSGFRERTVLAETRQYLGDGIEGIDLMQSHVHVYGGRATRTEAYSTVSFPLFEREHQL